MYSTINEVDTSFLPSPPLSPVSESFTQLPTPESPLLPLFSNLPCNDETEAAEFDLKYDDDDNDEFDFTEREIEYLESFLGFPIERPGNPSKEEILRNKYENMTEEGVEFNGEIAPYSYVIDILHSIGLNVINKKTNDAVKLCVYEIGTNYLKEFWVHPIFLSLQSFQFFKLFEENKENNEQEVLEIEVPSIKAFTIILYWLYTGDNSKILEIAKVDEELFKGIMEIIELLEINRFNF
ncbi:hypothetical protein H8356DRAFT_1052847 [Neocallimastix lanati (nom. inval.)]|uniref:BTB domain-containing protein n=1 Tax=Neocallimastix californiae TaxID=1754190 RepID=A0A1Y1ZV78_9FUNG|nr:hypothetical protein H8356DRAFT_1052847 [Neocallimastix sp. JGI-2020a]ORY14114.1 hypothetical protein LY90DRAFT_636492 [Neocallimastix californiae]|eukprot:ORY14114.1 hypothetical protein LY90DRAFT_636492 [Neocallimastix californiae]